MLEQSQSLALSDTSQEIQSSSTNTGGQLSDVENQLKNALHQKNDSINREISQYDSVIILLYSAFLIILPHHCTGFVTLDQQNKNGFEIIEMSL